MQCISKRVETATQIVCTKLYFHLPLFFVRNRLGAH